MKRRSVLRHDEFIELGKKGLKIWCYSPSNKFVCRIEINSAGLALYTGSKGGKKVANTSWEGLVKKLT